MKILNTTGQKTNTNSRLMYEYSTKLGKAILECENLGLEIKNVDWGKGYAPRLILRSNYKTAKFINEGTAIEFGSKSQAGQRLKCYQIQICGVKCLWDAEQITIN